MKIKSTYKKPVYIISLVLWILLALSSMALYLMVFVKQTANLKQIENFVNTKKVYLINSATCLGIAAILMLVFNIFDKLRLDAHNKSLNVVKRKKIGIIIVGIIFSVIFLIATVALFLIIYLSKNKLIEKLLKILKITVNDKDKIYLLYAAYGSAVALALILLRTTICSIMILPLKKFSSLGLSSNKSTKELPYDLKNELNEESKSSTIRAIKSSNSNANKSTTSEINFSKFNLKVVEDIDNKLTTSNTQVTNEKIQELQNLFNEVSVFAKKINPNKYGPIVKYINDSLEAFSIRTNENLTQESVITKINNLTINFKRVKLLLLLLDSHQYAVKISNKNELKLLGNTLANFVNKKIEEFNNLNSLRRIKILINEILEEYLTTRLNKDILEVDNEIKKYPNQTNLNNQTIDIINASKVAIENKNINAIKQAIIHLEKIKEAFSKL